MHPINNPLEVHYENVQSTATQATAELNGLKIDISLTHANEEIVNTAERFELPTVSKSLREKIIDFIRDIPNMVRDLFRCNSGTKLDLSDIGGPVECKVETPNEMSTIEYIRTNVIPDALGKLSRCEAFANLDEHSLKAKYDDLSSGNGELRSVITSLKMIADYGRPGMQENAQMLLSAPIERIAFQHWGDSQSDAGELVFTGDDQALQRASQGLTDLAKDILKLQSDSQSSLT